MKHLNLNDIYRTIHPNTKTYTYESKSLTLKLIDYVIKSETRTSIAPDHKAIFLNLKIDKDFKRGPGTWKFNNETLKEFEMLKVVHWTLTGPFLMEISQN